MIEMLVVLSILGSLTVMALAWRSGGSSTSLARTVDAVYAAVATARAEASRLDAVVGLTFDLGKRRFGADGQDGQDIPSDLTVTVSTSGANVSTGAARLLFYPDGSSSGGRIKLSTRSREIEIEVNWVSGRAVRGGA